MQRSRNTRWRRRRGKGLLPGNPEQWSNEHRGLDLREDIEVDLNSPLPVRLAFSKLDGVKVIPHGKVPCAQCFVKVLRGPQRRSWSALAVHLDGVTYVVYNDSHSPRRVRATLMEEFFHLRLGHPFSKIRVYDGRDKGRTFARGVEAEAYGAGAAALLPYKALKAAIERSLTSQGIADAFDVSVSLVQYRAKVTKLYRQLQRN